MSDLITVSKKDPRFRSYMEGTFSKELRALPVQSLNVNTEAEQVTFRLMPLREVVPPLWGLHWLQVLKVRNFLFVALPIFLVFVKCSSEGSLPDPLNGLFGAVGVLCLMAAGNLRNEYLDHFSGLDRMHPQSENHAIQKGWVTAAQVRRWSSVYCALGVLFGLPTLWLHPSSIFIVGITVLFGLFGMKSYPMGLKYRRWSEWSVFLLFGPLLTAGIQISLGRQVDWQCFFIGILTGWIAVFYLHLKNFGHLMVNNQADFNNTMTWLGFEWGKRGLLFWWASFIVLLQVYHFKYSPFFWQFIFLLSGILVLTAFHRVIRSLESPLGSSMGTLQKVGTSSILFVMGIWILQCLWTLWL